MLRSEDKTSIKQLVGRSEPTSQRGPVTTGSGRDGLDLEKFTSSISP